MPTPAKKSAPRAVASKPGAAKAPPAKPAASKQAPAVDDLAARFKAAAAMAKQTKKRPDNATLLKLYSYYKQAIDDDVSGARPGGFDFAGGAKFDAWSKLKGTSTADAMANYIKQVERLNRE